jgi:two-component system alkaline phosphatase synthesis response regulator PhoP
MSVSDDPKRILLVDDSQLFLELEGTFLKRSGYRVFTARSGREALEMARTHRPHLILLDLRMPDMEGDECCREIKSDPDLKDACILMLTAREHQEDRERCIEAGCDGYLTKTSARATLIARIQKGLNEKIRVMPRLPIKVAVRYAPLGEDEQDGDTLNISASGMFIITEQPPAPETKLLLIFQLPGLKTPFRLHGEVVWNTVTMKRGINTPGFGLRFTDVDEHTAGVIARYVEKRIRR